MHKLYEIIGTRYISIDQSAKLLKIFEQYTELDLTECKFSPENERLLILNYNKIKFCNTTNAYLDKILKHNNQAAVLKEKSIEAVPLQLDLKSHEDIIKLFQSIDKTKLYCLPALNKAKYISLVILLILRFPDLKIDLGDNASMLFQHVRRNWLPYKENHSRYIEVVRNAIVERELDNDAFYRPGVGFISEEKLVHDYEVLPYTFGSKDLYQVPEFKKVWDNAIKIIFEEEIPKRSMKDYIEVY